MLIYIYALSLSVRKMSDRRKKYDIKAIAPRIADFLMERLEVGLGEIHYSIVAGELNLPLHLISKWGRYIAATYDDIEYEGGWFRRV